MLRVLANNLAAQSRSLLHISRATYIRGYWPEPITQQTLSKFLADIDYFEEPRNYFNIGLKPDQQFKQRKVPSNSFAKDLKPIPILKDDEVDDILDLLAEETLPPTLNFDDVRLQGDQLINLAVNSGIFRDLFQIYEPDRSYIHFTKEQAERLDQLVPYYWITDQPHSRVKRNPKPKQPLPYFDPLVTISARFINNSPQDLESNLVSSSVSYYGNIIPAADALAKPSITLDGQHLCKDRTDPVVSGTDFSNWHPGAIQSVNFHETIGKKFSVILVNLDGLNEGCATLHWMISNIDPKSQDSAKYEETCDYLPVHGIRGFGYSRYVFIVLQHDSDLDSAKEKLKNNSLDARRFVMTDFLNKHKSINMTPVGLSWFQTQWDETSNQVFHHNLNMTAPTYEYVQVKDESREKKDYPGRGPFNNILENERDKKLTNELVLLERLKEVDPFDYENQYVPPKVPPTVFPDEDMPSWMVGIMFKKKNKIGMWRGLRPASAILPLDNNADLDYPIRPVASSYKSPPEYHNSYFKKLRARRKKVNPYSKPVNEHTPVFVDDDHHIHLNEVNKLVEKSSSSSDSIKK